MNAFQAAFEKAGLPPASVAFAAACHDLARLALNQQADPERAVHTWLGMAGGKDFRGALQQFLAAVASERRSEAKSDGDRGQSNSETQDGHAPSPSDPDPTSETGQSTRGAYGTPAPSLVGHERGRGGHSRSGTQFGHVASPATPTRAQIQAVTAAKAASARVMSGVFIPDHKGGSEAFDDLRIRFYDLTEKRLARMVGRGSVAYNLIRIAKMRRPANHDQLPDATSRDVFSAAEIQTMQREAAVFAGHGLISLPEELRSAVTEAVSHGEAAA